MGRMKPGGRNFKIPSPLLASVSLGPFLRAARGFLRAARKSTRAVKILPVRRLCVLRPRGLRSRQIAIFVILLEIYR